MQDLTGVSGLSMFRLLIFYCRWRAEILFNTSICNICRYVEARISSYGSVTIFTCLVLLFVYCQFVFVFLYLLIHIFISWKQFVNVFYYFQIIVSTSC